MIGAPKLLGKIFAGRLPARVLRYAFLNKLNRWLGRDNKRFEFERCYLESSDPWDFRTSVYEQRKYARIMMRILEWRTGSEMALELGCSIGIFSKSLAREFGNVLATDISEEALRRAADYCRDNSNLSFWRCDLRALNIDQKFDVIVCAEVLYYLEEDQADIVFSQLRRHLSPRGIVVLVNGIADSSGFWESALAVELNCLFKEAVPDEARPYQIAIFQNRSA